MNASLVPAAGLFEQLCQTIMHFGEPRMPLRQLAKGENGLRPLSRFEGTCTRDGPGERDPLDPGRLGLRIERLGSNPASLHGGMIKIGRDPVVSQYAAIESSLCSKSATSAAASDGVHTGRSIELARDHGAAG